MVDMGLKFLGWNQINDRAGELDILDWHLIGDGAGKYSYS